MYYGEYENFGIPGFYIIDKANNVLFVHVDVFSVEK